MRMGAKTFEQIEEELYDNINETLDEIGFIL